MPKTGRWGEDDTNASFDIKSRVVAGGAAGNLACPGVKLGDELITVINLSAAGANLVDVFTINAANQINNTGAATTAGMLLLVQWVAAEAGRSGY